MKNWTKEKLFEFKKICYVSLYPLLQKDERERSRGFEFDFLTKILNVRRL